MDLNFAIIYLLSVVCLLQTPSATLFMEVSYPFHSHLIGRSGKNINLLMEETGTRIHFPDGNRISGQVKSNGIVIRGEIVNLEIARQRIRVSHFVPIIVYCVINILLFLKASIPIEVVVDCFIEPINAIGESSLADSFSKAFGVILRFYPKIDGVNCQVNIRGQQNCIELLKQAVTSLGRITQTPLVSQFFLSVSYTLHC